MIERIGFIGLGAMGEPMARTLALAGFAIHASVHRSRAALERLMADPAVSGRFLEQPSAAAVARAAQLLVTCVPDAPDVEDAIFGPSGAVHGIGGEGAGIVMDMSTISPVASRSIGERLRERAVAFVDAPVSGGPARAATGELTIMVGGDAADVARVEPVLRAMGTPFHVGPVGMGETVKLVNQIIISSVMIADCEALAFARRSGADLNQVLEVIATATGSNYVLTSWLPKTYLAGSCQGGFALDLLRKDLAASLNAAEAIHLSMPLSKLAYQLYTARSEDGDGALDYSAVAKAYESHD